MGEEDLIELATQVGKHEEIDVRRISRMIIAGEGDTDNDEEKKSTSYEKPYTETTTKIFTYLSTP